MFRPISCKQDRVLLLITQNRGKNVYAAQQNGGRCIVLFVSEQTTDFICSNYPCNIQNRIAMTTATTIIGYLAALFMILGYLPQTIHTIRTRSTDDIALGTFLSMGVGSLCFMLQGYMTGNYPLVITNTLTTVMCVIIFGIKMQNDSRKRRLRSKRH